MTDPLLLDLPQGFETERLRLRAPQAGDGPALHEALAESIADMRRFLGALPWVACEQTVDSAETYCRNSQANFLARKDFPFLAFEKATGRLVGACGLHRVEWNTPKAEVGYWCRSSRTGQGFVTEAVEGAVAYAKRHMNVVRVELVTDEANSASRGVADRCGFTLEGVLRSERRAPDGSLRNTCIYARVARTD